MNTLPAIVKLPEILSVPLFKVKKAIGVPSTTVPCTVKFVGFNSSVLAKDVPLLMVSVLMFVVPPVPPNVLFAAPVKVISAPTRLAKVLKSSVPLLVRLPPTERECVVTTPAAPVWKMPPLSIVRRALSPGSPAA